MALVEHFNLGCCNWSAFEDEQIHRHKDFNLLNKTQQTGYKQVEKLQNVVV